MKNWILIFVVMLTLGLFTEYSFSEEKPKFKVIRTVCLRKRILDWT